MSDESLARIQARLEPFEGWRLWHLDRVVSTQDSLREALEQGEPEHLALSAGIQTGGRGRHGRSWNQEPEEDLALSVLLRPAGRYPPLLLPFLLPAALYEALGTMAVPRQKLRIKWPNDLLLDEKKIAGVLIEGDGSGAYLCGIGCNVGRRSFPEELRGRASSLRLEGLEQTSYPQLLEVLLLELARMLSEAEKGDWSRVLHSYAQGFRYLGEEVVVETGEGGIHGRLESLGPQGIRLDQGACLDPGQVLAIRRLVDP